uniref:Uncharacterized protein n=1 Tax=Bracon brevicornis TaxID=1563983 RepID=A0A6V7M9M1_9HYME
MSLFPKPNSSSLSGFEIRFSNTASNNRILSSVILLNLLPLINWEGDENEGECDCDDEVDVNEEGEDEEEREGEKADNDKEDDDDDDDEEEGEEGFVLMRMGLSLYGWVLLVGEWHIFS